MIYVTSDLHGIHPSRLEALLAKAGFSEEDFLFVLGDVIDRGDHGAELLLWLTEQPNVQLILGNHEAMLLACSFLFGEVNEENLEDLTSEKLTLLNRWMKNGCAPTLAGLRKLLKSDPELLDGILDYLRDAPLYETVRTGGKNYLLVHAGLGEYIPGKPLAEYDPHDLIWFRPTMDTRYSDRFTTVFGHTPTEFIDPAAKDRMLRTDTWLCVDTGAARGGSPMLLRLGDEKEFYL